MSGIRKRMQWLKKYSCQYIHLKDKHGHFKPVVLAIQALPPEWILCLRRVMSNARITTRIAGHQQRQDIQDWIADPDYCHTRELALITDYTPNRGGRNRCEAYPRFKSASLQHMTINWWMEMVYDVNVLHKQAIAHGTAIPDHGCWACSHLCLSMENILSLENTWQEKQNLYTQIKLPP